MEKTRVRKTSTVLQTAIPPKRGPAKHTETEGDLAVTVFDGRGFVKEIKTPPDAFRRVHEVMHANNSNAFDYPTIHPKVKNIIEDCRIHMRFWPWKDRETPQVIAESAASIMQIERDGISAALAKAKGMKLTATQKLEIQFSRFASHLRATAIASTMGSKADLIPIADAPKEYVDLSNLVNQLLRDGKQHEAAVLVQATFFPEKEEDEENKKKREKNETSDYEEVQEAERETSIAKEAKTKEELKAIEEAMRQHLEGDMGYGSYADRMPIIELAHTIATTHMTSGYRPSTSGPRIHRPALRKPVLPQRIFWKRSPVAPGGAILFDSSGSMSVNDEMLQDCCLRAPAATIAYYFGYGGGKGKLIVYARGGMRAPQIHPVECRDNAVDGPALEWLMQQEGPRIFVTDREFCSAPDTRIAIARLRLLEDMEEVEVIPSFRDFQKIYPRVEPN